jgi:hypothetical protein
MFCALNPEMTQPEVRKPNPAITSDPIRRQRHAHSGDDSRVTGL